MSIIQLDMTLDRKKEIAYQAADLLHQFAGRNGFIAGGYPRDIMLGTKPKDIDIFINAGPYSTKARRAALCDSIFAAFGQTWQQLTDNGDEQVLPGGGQINPNGYGGDAVNNLGVLLYGQKDIYYAMTNDGNWENLNVVFSANNDAYHEFDWSVCRIYIFQGRMYHQLDALDLHQVKFTGNDKNPEGALRHAIRMKERYPDIRYTMEFMWVNEYPDVYATFVRGGIFGDAARQVLPTEGQDGAGDQVRLDLGEGDREAIEWVTQVNRANARIDAIAAGRATAAAAALRGRATAAAHTGAIGTTWATFNTFR